MSDDNDIPTGYDQDDDIEKKTVDEFDDEDVEIMIEEYVDEIDEGYYTPTYLHLFGLVLLILAAAIGISLGVYRGWENNQFKCPVCPEGSMSTPNAIAIIPGEPDRTCQELQDGATEDQCPNTQQFTQVQCGCGTDPPENACSICVAGDASNLDAVLSVPNQPDRTCKDWSAIGLAGLITEQNCPLVQALAQDVCGCDPITASPTETPIVCDLCPEGDVTIGNATIIIPGNAVPQFCQELDLAGQNGELSEEDCPAIQSLANETCGCTFPLEPCTNICAVGNVQNQNGQLDVTSLNLPGLSTISCAEVQAFASSGSISGEICDSLQNVTAEVCGCGLDAIVDNSADLFPVCEICTPRGEIRNRTGVVEFNGFNVTCEALETLSQSGAVDDEECVGLRLVAAGPCDCGVTEADQAILAQLASVVGDDIYVPGTSEYEASRYLLFEDPRFNDVSSRRLQEELPTTPAEPEAQSELPTTPAGPEAQSGLVSLQDLSQTELVQRYMAIFLYYQSTSNREMDWKVDCAAAPLVSPPVDVTRGRRHLVDICAIDEGTNATKWLSASLECTWAGISCSNNSEIVGLKLDGFGLTGKLIPELVPALGSLTSLDLSNNALTGSIPTEYLNATSALELLKLNNNTLIGQLPQINNGDVLQELDVSDNQLEEVLLLDFSPALRILRIHNNDLEGNLSALIKAEDLIELNASGNKFGGNLTSTDPLFNLTELVLLDLGRNFFSGSLPGEISLLSNLETLRLDENNLNGNIPSEIGNLTALVTLDLSGNALGGPLPPEMGDLAELETLNVYSNFLNSSIPVFLSNAGGLQFFNFGKNELTGIVPLAICDLPNLTSLAGDCGELTCGCCTECCVEDGGCTPTVEV